MSLVIVHISERVHCETYRPNTNRQFSRATIDRQLSTKDDSSDRFLCYLAPALSLAPHTAYIRLFSSFIAELVLVSNVGINYIRCPI